MLAQSVFPFRRCVRFETKRHGSNGKKPGWGRRHLTGHSTLRLKLTALYGGAWVSDALKGYGEDGPELDRRNAIIAPES